MQDAWRAYLELAFGLTEASKKKAKRAAKDLAGKGGATAAQLQSLAEDLVATSRGNREALARLVRYEVDRALGALGLATAEEVAELNNRIRDLEQQVRAPQPQPEATTTTTTTTTTAPKTAARKVVAKKAIAKKTVAKQTTANPAKANPVKANPANANLAKATPANATAKKTTAKKTTG
jgi:polyhydroxyalkanoate synthesis regulator phasin